MIYGGPLKESSIMASYQQVRDSCSSNIHHGCSKAQMGLNKILSIISSIPPYETPKICDAEAEVNGNNRGVGIDLNLRLGPFAVAGAGAGAQESESQAENGNLSACSFVGKAAGAESDSVAESTGVLPPAVLEKSSEGECDPKEKPAEAVADKAQEVSEITNQRVESSEIDEEETKKLEEAEEGGDDNDDEVKKTSALKKGRENKNNDYLGLLVEAAKLISGNFGDDDEVDSGEPSQEKELSRTRNESSKSGSKRKKNKKSWRVVDWLGDVEEDTSPVVRSKRGRTQVLPTRYRDSVLEPWKPLSRPHRSSTTTTVSRIYPRSR